MMRWFQFSHLPPQLQEVSRPFALLAAELEAKFGQSTECQVALRKLLEAKDAAVRAAIEFVPRPSHIEPKEA